jgi:hypothetical protein
MFPRVDVLESIARTIDQRPATIMLAFHSMKASAALRVETRKPDCHDCMVMLRAEHIQSRQHLGMFGGFQVPRNVYQAVVLVPLTSHCDERNREAETLRWR